MKITNMLSRTGKPVTNQILIQGLPGSITTDGVEYREGDAFSSYGKMICIKSITGQVYLDCYAWNYSKTTGRYRNIFLDEGIKETRKKIASGEYILANLNDDLQEYK